MSRVQGTLFRIKKHCDICGMDISDVVSGYDRSRTGQITATQLQRAFSTYGIRIGNQDFQEILLEFKSGDGVSLPSLISAVKQSDIAPPPDTHPEVADELRKLAQDLGAHGQTVWDCVAAYHRGHRVPASLPPGDFLRIVQSTPHSRAVAAAFTDKATGEISIAHVDAALKTAVKTARPPAPKPDQVLNAIDQVVRRQVDARLSLESYDKVNRGKVSRLAFIGVLSSFSGVQMNESDIQIVADYYTQEGFVDYFAFLKDVNEAYQDVKDVRTPRQSQPDIAKVLDTLRTVFTERRISARDLFPATDATISKYRFEKIVAQTAPILTHAEVTAVAQTFLTGNTEVDIARFVAAVEVRRDSDPELLGRVVAKVKAELESKKFVIRPVLTRFDRSGSGEVFLAQFLVALQDCHVALGAPEIEELLRGFPGSGSKTISISAFCDAVDPILPPPSAADEPPATVDQPPPAPSSVAAPSDKVRSIVGRIGRFAQTLGVNLLDEFHLADRTRRGRIGDGQWRSVIALLGGRVPDPELQTVFAAYLVDGRFDYGRFCQDAAEPVQAVEGGSVEFEEALKRCKALLATKMITIDVLFRRYDPSRSGFVPASAVPKAFCDYGLVLSPEVVATIQRSFADQRSSDRVNYLDLGKRIDSVELPRDEHRSTLFKQSTHAQHELVLAEMMHELKQKLDVRPRGWRRLSAKAGQATVSEAELIDALADAGVVLKKEQIESVVQWYRVPQTREIDFARFIHDIENTNLIRGL